MASGKQEVMEVLTGPERRRRWSVEEKLAKFNISVDKMEIVSDEIESIRETDQEFPCQAWVQ